MAKRKSAPVAPSTLSEPPTLSELFRGTPEEALDCLNWLRSLDKQKKLLAQDLRTSLRAADLGAEARQHVLSDLLDTARDYLQLLHLSDKYLMRASPEVRLRIDPVVSELYRSIAKILARKEVGVIHEQFVSANLAASRPFEALIEVLQAFIREKNRSDLLTRNSHKPRRHSPDFRQVYWDEVEHNFTAGQAEVVRQLWEAAENGTPEVGDRTLLAGAELDSKRLSDLFSGTPAEKTWKKLIIPGKTKGSSRLIDAP